MKIHCWLILLLIRKGVETVWHEVCLIQGRMCLIDCFILETMYLKGTVAILLQLFDQGTRVDHTLHLKMLYVDIIQ